MSMERKEPVVPFWTSPAPSPDRRRCLPSPPREIRELHGGAAGRYRLLAQRPGGAPGRGIVHIDIRRPAFADGLYQAPGHHEIHAVVAAQFAGQLAGLLPKRMLELLLVWVERSELLLTRAVQVNPRRVVAEDALGPGNQIDAVVGLRAGGVVLQGDQPALDGPDQTAVEIALAIDLLLPRIVGREMLLPVGGQGRHQ